VRSTISSKLTRLEQQVAALQPPGLDRWQQEAVDRVRQVLGEATAAACQPDIAQRPSPWLQIALLVGCIQDGAPPAELDRELRFFHAWNAQWQGQITRALAAIEAWLATPAGHTRPINVLYGLRFPDGTTERTVRRAIVEALRAALGQPRLDWEALSLESQDALVCEGVAYVTQHRHPQLLRDETLSPRTARILVADVSIALVHEWQRRPREHQEQLVAEWAEEMEMALDACGEDARGDW